jgi:hypothetical protein
VNYNWFGVYLIAKIIGLAAHGIQKMKNLASVQFIQAGVLSLISLLCTAPAWGQASLFLRDYPESYTVQENDTLWNIASQFLQDPLRWPDVWLPDRYLDNPEAIYPGDVIRVDSVNGMPRLVAQRSMLVERLAPEVREIPMTSSIPAIALENINSSFTTNRIVPPEVFAAAPYIVSTIGNNLIIGTGDEIYARGNWPAGAGSFEIYRQVNEYLDGKESLGVELVTLGFATIIAHEADDVKRMLINSSASEIKVGDHLLVREETRLDPTIFPTEPSQAIDGNIIALTTGERLASLLDSVVINLGSRDGLEMGNVLSIEKPGERMVDDKGRSRKGFGDQVRDVFTNDRLQLPNKEIGTLLVYRTFEKLSYGVILTITEPTGIGDIVTNP